MKKMTQRIWNNEKGFTLIELIIVIAILAIIAAIAVPNILTAVDNSRRTTDVSTGKMIADAAATVRAKNDSYSTASGTYDITSATATADFIGEVFNQLNGKAPVPKFKGTAISEDHFIFTIDATTGVIKVYVSANGTYEAADLMVYPTPTSDYDNK